MTKGYSKGLIADLQHFVTYFNSRTNIFHYREGGHQPLTLKRSPFINPDMNEVVGEDKSRISHVMLSSTRRFNKAEVKLRGPESLSKNKFVIIKLSH